MKRRSMGRSSETQPSPSTPRWWRRTRTSQIPCSRWSHGSWVSMVRHIQTSRNETRSWSIFVLWLIAHWRMSSPEVTFCRPSLSFTQQWGSLNMRVWTKWWKISLLANMSMSNNAPWNTEPSKLMRANSLKTFWWTHRWTILRSWCKASTSIWGSWTLLCNHRSPRGKNPMTLPSARSLETFRQRVPDLTTSRTQLQVWLEWTLSCHKAIHYSNKRRLKATEMSLFRWNLRRRSGDSHNRLR